MSLTTLMPEISQIILSICNGSRLRITWWGFVYAFCSTLIPEILQIVLSICNGNRIFRIMCWGFVYAFCSIKSLFCIILNYWCFLVNSGVPHTKKQFNLITLDCESFFIFYFLIIALQITNLALSMCWVFVHKFFWLSCIAKLSKLSQNLITLIDKYLENKK